ncbi:MAG TPA: rhombosortase, partial [Burkholderiaceae bacterium]|nr:rhombosortase [Burkholderiaceae bacterium]
MNRSVALIELSRAERLALGGALALIALHALPAAPWLEYRRALLATEPWRILTGHFVHLNWPHALANAAAWLIVARLFAPELGARRQLLIALAACIGIAFGLAWLYPQIAWYRGFSGTLHALFFAGATRAALAALRSRQRWRAGWLPLLLAAGGAVKVALEQPSGANTPYADWLGAPTVPQAHLLGAAVG